MSDKQIKRKVVIVGAGSVGSTFAYALAQRGIAEEIALIDQNKELARGQVLDLMHGLPYYPTINITEGSAKDYADAALVVITAGAKQKPGQSRLELLKTNVSIIESIVDDIKDQNSRAIILVVTNPVDILTYFAWKRSGWERSRVIGSGTVLDSARLRYLISSNCQIDVKNVHAYVMGEHGDSEFAAWSMSHIGGIPIKEYAHFCDQRNDGELKRKKIEQQVKDSAYHIIDYKGSTWFAVGLAMVRITEAILLNQRSILTVSTCLDGEYGLTDVCLGVPSLVTANGVEEVLEKRLDPDEKKLLRTSASILKNSISEVEDS